MSNFYGDSPGKLAGKQVGKNDNLLQTSTQYTTLIGDSNSMTGASLGGNDSLNFQVANSAPLPDPAIHFVVIGDAEIMSGHSTGGDDLLAGGPHLITSIFGDAFLMKGNSVGGDDRFGAAFMSVENHMYGDAYFLDNSSVGGNDLFVGGTGATTNYLIGDAWGASGNARGGDDKFFSKDSTDHMWGDFALIDDKASTNVTFGQDSFVLYADNGHDYIHDFHRGEDIINLIAKGIRSIDDLTMTQSGKDLLVSFDSDNSVTLIGIDALDAGDFVFAP